MRLLYSVGLFAALQSEKVCGTTLSAGHQDLAWKAAFTPGNTLQHFGTCLAHAKLRKERMICKLENRSFGSLQSHLICTTT